MSRLKGITPHLIVELAKIKVHNGEEGFAREPVRLLIRRVMTFAPNDPDAASGKEQLRIRPNNGQTHLNISQCQVALSSSQTAELVGDMDSDFFNGDDLHETPTQLKDKQEGFVIGEQEARRRVQSIESGLMRNHAAQAAEVNKNMEFRPAKQSFLTIREPVVLSEDAYAAKGLLGKISQVRLEVELERKRLMAIEW
ncbi:hypothetical protein MMC29_000466 [Sticta canariensis]|nr:hypothetical protein [Sticta canariensis]